ncbi:hypothetical protein AAF712_006557 [Marasmius tenuissimus]|uniref:Cupredoxin n=1 Tax=Marasmius tenuissimus TaxID=585030 RepID=A0ABR2ZZF0_9AGAR
MTFTIKSFGLILATFLPAAVYAGGYNHKVTVGADSKLLFDPEYVHAESGDSITFVFNPKNHSVTQSNFDTPCNPLYYGFDSGFMPVAPDSTQLPEVTLHVNYTAPMWFYCKQPNPQPHCQQGMVFAINPPPEGDPRSFSAFKSLAKQSEGQKTDYVVVSEDHKIIVGVDGKLAFGPANITTAVGDTVTFEFRPKAHGVTQSSFHDPCTPLVQSSNGREAGFESGLMPVAPNATYFPTFTIKINDTKPIWGYCPQTMPSPHCGQGMVFSIDADEYGPSNFAAFLDKAKQSAQWQEAGGY